MEDLIGVSGSYNRDKNPEKSAAKKYRRDQRRGSELQTIPLFRGDINGIDNLKFLYPLSGVPIIAYTILNAVDQTERVRVIGNPEIGNLVGLMNDELGTSIEYVSEGKKLSLACSISALLKDSDSDKNYFVSGDVPFAGGYATNGTGIDLRIDLNKKSIFSRFLHVKRNFYNWAKLDEDYEYFKEPNVYFVSRKGLPALLDMANIFYANRKSGELPRAVMHYLRERIDENPKFKREILKRLPALGFELTKLFSQWFFSFAPYINLNRVNEIGSKAMGINFMICFYHNNPFLVLDIDGLNNDYPMYERITRNLELAGRLDERIIRLRQAIRSNAIHFPLVTNFEDVIMEYARGIDRYLPRRFRINLQSVEQLIEKSDHRPADELTALLLND